MREIKFRAWHPDKKVMVMSGIIVCDGETYLNYREFEDGIQTNNAMQFTGLHDKNGKEIFEGDVVRTKEGTLGYVSYMKEQCRWGIFREFPQYEVPQYVAELSFLRQPETIGNIYENPELLKP